MPRGRGRELAVAAGRGDAAGLGAAAGAMSSGPRAVPRGEAGREDLARAGQRESLAGIPGRCALWRPWNGARIASVERCPAGRVERLVERRAG